MPDSIPADSVGLVTTQCQHFDQPLTLDCGRVLSQYDLVFETYGELNPERSNAILICHALSGDHHAAGYHSMEDKKPGWWDSAIGPGKPLGAFDADLFVEQDSGFAPGQFTAVNPLLDSLFLADLAIGHSAGPGAGNADQGHQYHA